jgi:hypothetical protein
VSEKHGVLSKICFAKDSLRYIFVNPSRLRAPAPPGRPAKVTVG